MKACIRITAALSFVLFVVFSTSALHAQQRGGRRGGQPRTGTADQAPRTTLPPEFDNRPFDITLQQLPPQYLGCDAELVYTRIKNGKENSKRKELESTQKDEAGTKQSPLLPLTAALDLESTYAFRFNPEERLYNERDHVLKVYCPFSTVSKNGKEDESRRGLRVKYQPRVDNRHVGTNAYGAQVEFVELKFREYLIAFANFREFPVERGVVPSGTKQTSGKDSGKSTASGGSDESPKRETITGSLNVTPPEAKQLEERVAVLAICKLVDPYITSDTVQQKPTPDNPRDYLAQYYYIEVRLLEVWFYDFDTGKVFMKMKAEQPTGRP